MLRWLLYEPKVYCLCQVHLVGASACVRVVLLLTHFNCRVATPHVIPLEMLGAAAVAATAQTAIGMVGKTKTRVLLGERELNWVHSVRRH